MREVVYSRLAVLVVDDIRSVRLILRALLRGIGVQKIEEASDGAEALQMLANNHYDLVITDLSMKPMDGIELTRQLRKQESGPKAFLPILMISGYSEKSKIQQAAEAGVSAFLLKPITPSAVAAKIDTVIRQSLPAIRSQKYFGPDRRRRMAWVRSCRRSKATYL